MTETLEDQIGLFDQDTWFGKTSQEHSQATAEKTSKPSSRKSQGSQAKKLPMFLYLRGGGGQSQAASWVSEMTEYHFPSLGDFTTHSFGECPKEENVSRLSQILEERPHPKYSLSAAACLGILRRAWNRGKQLPPELMKALIRQSACKETELTEQIQPDATEQDGAGGGSYTLNTIDRPAVVSFQERAGKPGGGKGILIQNERTGALSTSNNQMIAGFDGNQGAKAGSIGYEEERGRLKQEKLSTSSYAVDLLNVKEDENTNGPLMARASGSLNSNNVVRTKSDGAE